MYNYYVIRENTMTYKDIQAIVLAAGKSTRFNTQTSKLLEKICGQEMIAFPAKLLSSLHIDTTYVLGFKHTEIQETIEKHHNGTYSFTLQKEQKGTGDAVMTTQAMWNKDYILIMNGDTPLITPEIINSLIEHHEQEQATISLVTAHNPEPSSYGRVIKDETGIKIVENKHFTGSPQEFCCVNAGIYLIQKDFLQNYVSQLQENEVTKELYLTDLVELASKNNHTVTTITAPFDRVRGVNTLRELWAVEQIQRSDILTDLMNKGVRFHAPQTNHVDMTVSLGKGSTIHAGVRIYGQSVIENNVTIEPYSLIYDAYVEQNATILPYTIVNQSRVGKHASVGPFAHIRNNSVLECNSTIGNFVEVKNTTVGTSSSAKHLTYLGDSTVGTNTNIGAGTITCNFDGISKHKTTIKDNAFVGSNNTLIAPLTIGNNAITAAGSVITEDVPDNALALGRSRQINKEEYAKRLRLKQKQKAACNQFTPAIKTTTSSDETTL